MVWYSRLYKKAEVWYGMVDVCKKVVTTLVLTLGPKEDGIANSIYRNGSIFSDAPTHGSMAQLVALANDKQGWANHIRSTPPQLHKRKRENKAAAARARLLHQTAAIKVISSPPLALLIRNVDQCCVENRGTISTSHLSLFKLFIHFILSCRPLHVHTM